MTEVDRPRVTRWFVELTAELDDGRRRSVRVVYSPEVVGEAVDFGVLAGGEVSRGVRKISAYLESEVTGSE